MNLAKLKGTESTIIFPTGYQTNITVLQALTNFNSFFFCDKLSHNSLLMGARLGNKNFKAFCHNDINELSYLISTVQDQDKPKWIVSESVFSMDGDLAPVDDLNITAKNNKCHFYLDEAHAIGVFGKNGMGLLNNPDHQTLIMGTFSKGCGSFGAYIACSNIMKDFLINFLCRGDFYYRSAPLQF